jgi:DNA-binding transcriptional MerR regulator
MSSAVLIGSTESARILNVDKATLTRWVAAGILVPAHKLPGKNGALLFNRADIERLRDTREQAAS